MRLQACLIVLTLLSSIYSCADSRSQPDTTGLPTNTTPSPQESVESINLNDPTCCDPVAATELKEAWKAFAESGEFRLARRNDFKDAEALSHPPYAYAWGDLGYDRDPSQSYHLAVILVDERRPEDSKFSVAIFSAPRSQGGKYRHYWLLRNQDLSQAFFSGFSGSLGLVINHPERKATHCNIRWNSKRQEYQCR